MRRFGAAALLALVLAAGAASVRKAEVASAQSLPVPTRSETMLLWQRTEVALLSGRIPVAYGEWRCRADAERLRRVRQANLVQPRYSIREFALILYYRLEERCEATLTWREVADLPEQGRTTGRRVLP
jgi:hypothetical protein